MKEKCDQLYESMMLEMDSCGRRNQSEKEQIECAFRTCEMTWKKLQIILAEHRFRTEMEEVWFFKNIKPQFTSLLEYYALVYKAALFLPEEEPQNIPRFWQNELHRAKRFFAEHETFYTYYKSGITDMDTIYFVRANGDPTSIPASRIYADDPRAATTHDHLVASIIARERYIEYIEQRMAGIRDNPSKGSGQETQYKPRS